jgi:hypothetical protein
MDRASQALAAAFSADQPGTYRSVAEKCNVPRSTLHRRKHGGTSKEVKAQRQQYLTVEEERALVSFLLLMSSLGQPVRIKYIPTLAFSIARRRSTTNKRRGCAQPQVPRPHLINYIRDDCVRCAGSLTVTSEIGFRLNTVRRLLTPLSPSCLPRPLPRTKLGYPSPAEGTTKLA